MKQLIPVLFLALISSASHAVEKYTLIGVRNFVPVSVSSIPETMTNHSFIALNQYQTPVIYTSITDKKRGFVMQRKLSEKLSFDSSTSSIILNDEVSQTICGHLNESATGIANVNPTGACVVFDEISIKANGSAELSTFIITK